MKKRIYQHYICRKNVSGGIIALYVGGGIALESYFQKRLYEHTFPQLAVFHFLSWLHFTSSVGRYSFPQLAVFHFLSWLKHYQKKTIVAWKNYCKLHKTDTPPVVVLCFENCQAIIIGKYNKNYRKWASTVPMWGKQLSHLGQAHCPKWANFVLQTAPKTLHWTDRNPLFWKSKIQTSSNDRFGIKTLQAA